MLARLGLVTSFGHVSARAGTSILITPAADLATVTEASLVEVPLTATALPPQRPGRGMGAPGALPGPSRRCRHRPGPAAGRLRRRRRHLGAAAAARSGRLAGESVPVHDRATLLRSPDLAGQAARALPAGEALLLRGNGALTLGDTPGLAVTRMWLLAAACDVFLAARAAGPVTPLTGDEIAAWRAAGAGLLPRLWQHLRHQ